MRIFELGLNEGFIELQLKNYEKDNHYIEMLDSTDTLADKWSDIEVKIIKKGKKSDFPYIWSSGGDIVISENAKINLSKFLSNDNIELLPMRCDTTIYYIVHIIKPSNINYYMNLESLDDIYFVEEELISNNINNLGLFRAYLLGKKSTNQIFITEDFVNEVQKTNLKGFSFNVLWDSDK